MRDYNKELLKKSFKEFTPEERKELWLAYFSNEHIVEVCSTATLDELCSDSCDAKVCILTDIDNHEYSIYTQSVCKELERAVLFELSNFDDFFKDGYFHIEVGFFTLGDESDDYYVEKEKEVWVDSYDGYKECRYSVIYEKEN